MKRHYFLVPLLLAVALAACQSPASRAAEFNQETELTPGQRVSFGDELHVEFVGVVDDSRCPADETCVWAGEVKVQLSTRIGSAEPVQHEVVAGQHASVGNFRVFVVRVLPERTTERQISPEEYRATVRVERAGG